MTRSTADTWEVWGASTRGASHVRKGMRNQDAIGFLPASHGSPRCALVVSDGHGGKAHPLSHLGSRFAVECTLAALGDLLESEADDPCNLSEDQRAELVVRIHQHWIGRVTAHANSQGIDPDLLNEVLVPYGATLVAAAISERHILVLQIGDGDILIGSSVHAPSKALADDAGLFGEETYSLCRLDAPSSARSASLPRSGPDGEQNFVMLSTDGLAKSFAGDAEFLAIGRHYRDMISNGGPASVAEGLGAWLANVTAQGSGDDIALGFLVGSGLRATKGAAATAVHAAPARTPLLLSMGWGVAALLFVLVLALGNPWQPWTPFAPAQPAKGVVQPADPPDKAPVMEQTPASPATPPAADPPTTTAPPEPTEQKAPDSKPEENGNV